MTIHWNKTNVRQLHMTMVKAFFKAFFCCCLLGMLYYYYEEEVEEEAKDMTSFGV
jgi:hypothetical protein